MTCSWYFTCSEPVCPTENLLLVLMVMLIGHHDSKPQANLLPTIMYFCFTASVYQFWLIKNSVTLKWHLLQKLEINHLIILTLIFAKSSTFNKGHSAVFWSHEPQVTKNIFWQNIFLILRSWYRKKYCL